MEELLKKLELMNAEGRYYFGAALIGSIEALLQNKDMQEYGIVSYDALYEVYEEALNAMEVVNKIEKIKNREKLI